MNGYQDPNHLWFLHEEYYGVYESHNIIMRDSDFSNVFYILRCLEKYHDHRPFDYYITYEGDDISAAKQILNDYQEFVDLMFNDENIMVASYIKNFL